MRAHFYPDLAIMENYTVKDDALHHLVNVIRITPGEELLLLSGQGLSVKTVVESISKKEMKLKFLSSEEHTRKFTFDLALGMPKREALELCLKQAAELGFRKIYLIRSDYSQMRFPEEDRAQKLLISALEQSNAAFLPVCEESSWEDLPWNEYLNAVMLDSQTLGTKSELKAGVNSSHLLIVGPEGGFSPEELAFLHAKNNLKIVNLPTPILRTPTALAAGAGVMIECLLKS